MLALGEPRQRARDEYEPLSVAWMESERAQQGAPRHFSEMRSHQELVEYLQSEAGGEYLQLQEVDRPKQLQLEQSKIDLLESRIGALTNRFGLEAVPGSPRRVPLPHAAPAAET